MRLDPIVVFFGLFYSFDGEGRRTEVQKLLNSTCCVSSTSLETRHLQPCDHRRSYVLGSLRACYDSGVRNVEIVEEELTEIAALQDDLLKLERIAAWSLVHPDEVAFAWKYLRGRKGFERWAKEHPQRNTFEEGERA